MNMVSQNGIRLRIDKSGRIVVPKPLRERLGLKPGTELEVLDQQGGMLLRAGHGAAGVAEDRQIVGPLGSRDSGSA